MEQLPEKDSDDEHSLAPLVFSMATFSDVIFVLYLTVTFTFIF